MVASSHEVVLSIAFYTACSSVMLVANKVTIFHLPVPALVFLVQLLVAVSFILSGRSLKLIPDDPLTRESVSVFAPYIAAFVASLYSNGEALKYSNVETVIVFRASTPLFVSILDSWFLGRERPSRRSTLSLLGIVLGAIGYVHADSEFHMHGLVAYTWVTIYVGCIVFEMTYAKKLISGIKFTAPVWGSVWYTNILAILPMFITACVAGEFEKVATIDISSRGVAWLVLSSLIGVGISWAGWNCREKLSAASYTLVGVVCKFITVLLNVVIWDKHATPYGLGWLVLCLASSTLYQQAPLRKCVSPAPSSAAMARLHDMQKGGTAESNTMLDNNGCRNMDNINPDEEDELLKRPATTDASGACQAYAIIGRAV